MMSCKEVAERASKLIDGECSPWEALRIRLHLAMCDGCSGFVTQLRTLDKLAKDAVGTDQADETVPATGKYSDALAALRDKSG
ncbi:zf-HC2 domain-containing protein [Rhodobacteraceae bacterium ASV31]|nr:zf-HC2 domain-containing protein [Anianabacter salinae]